jgi:hypothetical protein
LHAPPEPTHIPLVVSQQSPVAVHVLPGQQICPVLPHVVHTPPAHTVPFEHVPPAATHCPDPGSQQAPGVAAQELPAQHASPTPPHTVHVVPMHTWAPPLHAVP